MADAARGPSLVVLNVDAAVRDRYSAAAQATSPELCCPVSYAPQHLAALPAEIIERDYGCGDPSRYLHVGETVLDLGSGGGKICYIAAQVVGPTGRVIGVDCNDEMLALARKHQKAIGDKLGYHNVEFRRGRIQDLALSLDALEAWLCQNPVRDAAGWLRALEQARELRRAQPLIADNSVDVVVSNCVLNLVSHEDRRQLFAELHRALKPGGRAVISDIASNRPVPVELQNDPTLWSGCVSGAFEESEFLAAFAAVGFVRVQTVDRGCEPWTTVAGIEFRSVTVQAYKPAQGS